MDSEASQYRSPPKRVVLGHLNNHNGNSPISPMANLKLLTKVATSRFSMEENSEYICKSEDQVQVKSRRLRSLSYICEKFLLIYPLDIQSGESKQISLGYLASILGIEKRRVYDIINVVASLQMAVKVCKDKYKWYGNQNLPQFLTKLKIYALQNKINHQVQELLKQKSSEKHEDHCYNNGEISKFSSYPEKPDDNRIGILCQKFVMMFLVIAEEGALNLAGIAKLILSDEQGKTGMRRLYDVANILETLGLIKRHGKIHKKPSFIYCGPKVDLTEAELATESVTTVIRNVDFCDTSSESSSDVPQRKIDSMLEVVCTELEKFDDGPKAKRKLCLTSDMKKEPISLSNSATFIKAPTQSFRFSCNQITEKPDKASDVLYNFNNNNIKSSNDSNCSDHDAFEEKFVTNASHDSNCEEIVITKIQKPIKLIKPRNIPNIQNGAIYRAVKNGNFIKLVKL
ncbi:unnamed protein product [Nezara viridula]|uniref:E2F/DP family winged-helix DNA-binding domain-containing protein n=1 Tax=Nezara viridula TaxID=85310 RepID=A0A9P0MNP7_NEZVI|nr:unnamed protein product [Nezara viridula]